MFFDDAKQIRDIALRTSTAIFVVPAKVKVEIPGAIVLQPEEKTVITIEQAHAVMGLLGVRQTQDLIVLIRPAEKLGNEAANALLKSLEEPGDKVHFVLVTDSPSSLLPTILSRAEIYYLRTQDAGINASEQVKDLAKRLMAAKPSELVAVAEQIAKKKEGVREFALSVVGTAVEMLYKTYFITNKEIYLAKLPRFLAAYEGIARNGHIKLQIVSNLSA